jgi:UDP-N-acetylmuramyl pentapeptide phosphotransferase/UDP-N-acetylglucosamine-1-phosphate transferase
VELIAALAITAVLTPAVARAAEHFGVVDRPGPLKVQSRPIPYLGGLAVLAGVLVPVLLDRPSLAVPLVLATLLGLADDLSDLDFRVRLVCAALIGVSAGIAVDVPTALIPVTSLVVIVLINAVNLLDGLDGLASATVLVSTVAFAILLDGSFRGLALAIAGATAGFILWNRPPARIYLGDAGSYLLGTGLAILGAATLRDGEPAHTIAAAVLLVGVPVGDMAIAILRRWRAQRPLFKGDRGHVYDQLVARRWTAIQATVACVAAQAALACVALGVDQLSSRWAVAVVVATVAVVALWAIHTFASPSSWRTE